MKSLLIAISLCAPLCASAANDCFTIYDTENAAVYRSVNSPIDLSGPISDAMAAKYPGHYLVWTRNDHGCPEFHAMPKGTHILQGDQLDAAGASLLAKPAQPVLLADSRTGDKRAR